MEKFCRAVLLALVFVGFNWPVYAQNNLMLDAFGGSTPGTLTYERAQFPGSMTREQVAAMLNRVAWAHRAEGWGLLRKGAGNSCPINGTYISCDILVHAPSITHWDVLRDSENAAIPQWNAAGPCVLSDSSGCQMSNFLPPFDPGGGTTTGVNQPNQVQNSGITPVQDLSGLSSSLANVRADLYAQMERVYADLAARDAQRAAQIAAVDQHLTQIDNEPSWLRKVFTNPVVLGVLSGAFGLWGTQQAVK